MPEIRGHILPVYVLVDESGSMSAYLNELNGGMAALHQAMLREPMAAAKVRFSVLGFSDTVVTRLHLADLRRVEHLPRIVSRSSTSYGEAFGSLLQTIPRDIADLKSDGYAVHRPAVFFLSDGSPNDPDQWVDVHRRLSDRSLNPAAPNIIACGIGEAQPQTILDIASRPEFAFVSISGIDVGRAVAKFLTALTKSLVVSGRSLATGQGELYVDPPEGFHMAIEMI